jgi:copper chaperone
MTDPAIRLLPLAATNQTGCACCTPSPEAAGQPRPEAATADFSLQVQGMSCSHCVSAVTKKLSALDGVTGVRVSLVPGGTSTVSLSADRPVPEAALRAAIEDAGYRITES